MRKIFMPTAEIRATHEMVNEDVWFMRYQRMLVRMANTDFGRDLLCIPKRYPRVIAMKKNAVICLLENDGVVAKLSGDFRIGSKWANVIRFRWDAFKSYSRYFLNDEDDRIILAPLVRTARSLVANTLTAYPDPSSETVSFDGYLYPWQYPNGAASWATCRTKTTTDTTDHASASGETVEASLASGKYYNLKSQYLWDTSSIGAGSTITSATASFFGTGTNNNSQSTYVALVVITTASNTGPSSADADPTNWSTTKQNQINIASWSTSAYNDYGSIDITKILKTSITKFGLQSGCDIDNVAPTVYNSTNTFWADQTGTTNDPKLVVNFTLGALFLKTYILSFAVNRSYSY